MVTGNQEQIAMYGINVGNARYENTSTVGVKAFINNPLEDIDPPIYSYKLDTIDRLLQCFEWIDQHGIIGRES